jgi:aromatic-L-amino-acid/L-tryptophan decarboxylase
MNEIIELNFSRHEHIEEGLDPKDWDEVKALAHQMVDDMMDFLKTVDQRPVWTPVPQAVKSYFDQSIPQGPTGIQEIYQDFKTNILPYPLGNINPKHFSWVMGTGTPLGALADFLASSMNSNSTIGDHSALYVDRQVIGWCKEMMGFPVSATGVLVSGGSIANITALIVARNAFAADIRSEGVYALPGKLTAYCSSETHGCIDKAIETLGLGNRQLRKIPVDKDYKINVQALRERIAADRAEGYIPFCIIANAGTVNTGAIDPLDSLREIADSEKIWLHVDGAFGALATLVPEYQGKLKSLKSVDSIAFDLHKWMYMPYEVGCVLIKEGTLHRQAFASPANYLSAHERGLAAGPETISNYGMELSRGFKALKVWMSIREHGLDKYRRLITQNIQQAFYLGEEIKSIPNLELMAAVSLNIVCYRYNPGGLNNDELNQLNKELLMRMHEQAIATPSYTVLGGSYALRVAITNHRTRKKDLDDMIAGSIRLGDILAQELRPIQ